MIFYRCPGSTITNGRKTVEMDGRWSKWMKILAKFFFPSVWSQFRRSVKKIKIKIKIASRKGLCPELASWCCVQDSVWSDMAEQLLLTLDHDKCFRKLQFSVGHSRLGRICRVLHMPINSNDRAYKFANYFMISSFCLPAQPRLRTVDEPVSTRALKSGLKKMEVSMRIAEKVEEIFYSSIACKRYKSSKFRW